MKVTLGERSITVERGDSPKVYSESLLLHKIKTELIAQGHDVIKKRMWRDGHIMGGDETQYIRERKWNWCAFDNAYAIRLLHTDYNTRESVSLLVERWDANT